MNIEAINKNPVVRISFEFALDIVGFCEGLEQEKKYIVARQLLKSGTSIGASVTEAQNAESKADFIHKFKLAAKEAEETQYWLLICNFAKQYPDSKDLLQKIETLNRMIGKIISTSRRKNLLSCFIGFFI